LCVVLRGPLALLLSQLLMPCGLVLCSPFLLLVHAFATHRSVASDVACGLLAAAEQLVEQSHVLSPSSLVRIRVPKRQQKQRPSRFEQAAVGRSPARAQAPVRRGLPGG